MVDSGTVKLAEQFFPAMCSAASVNVLTGWLSLMWSALSIFRRSLNRRIFPLGFLCATIGLAYLLNGNVVIMPYLFSRPSSTRIMSLRLIGAGRFWL